MSNSFYTTEELKNLGLKSVGDNVLISKFARIYKPEAISIGSNVRIDDFCILSGGEGISIGNYVHISAYVALYGNAGIEIQDFVNISTRATIFSESEDPLGESLMGPMVPKEFRIKFIHKKVTLYKHSGVGPHCVILPGANLHEGAVVGAHSYVTKPQKAWSFSKGFPAKTFYTRKKNILELEKELLSSFCN